MTLEEFLEALRLYFGLGEAVDVRQSYEGLRDELQTALNQWPGRPAEDLEILFTLGDRLIAYYWRANDGRAWEIPWSRGEDGSIVFGDVVQVERVVRFEPVAESQAPTQRLTEQVEQPLRLVEAQGRQVKAIGITADVVNGNRRRYARAVLAQAVADLNSHLHESAGQGRLIATGEAEHPSDKGGRPNILETVVKWEAASLDAAGKVLLEGAILPTSKGKDILALMEGAVPIGVSMRGYGRYDLVEVDGVTVQEVRELTITGFDLVTEPSDPYARLVESRQADESEGDREMTVEELLQLLREKPELAEAMMKRLGLADRKALAEALGVEDPAKVEEALKAARKAQEELETRRRQEAIEAAIVEATKELPYGELNEQFVEAVRAANAGSPEAVAGIVEAKRKEYDALMAKVKLVKMGRGDVQVLGPVFERETGQPEYTRPAFEITERMIERNRAQRRDLKEAKTRSEIFAKRYLEMYDQAFKRQLIAEAQALSEFQEAEQTSDLNLPYSVSRSIIMEAVPQLVAVSVFDVDIADASPTRVYFEAYAGESGSSAAITDEEVTSDEGAWANLAHKRVRPGTVVVTSDPAGTTYAEYTDYVVDYGNGRIYTLATGTIGDATALLVDYTYDVVREGEMAAIQRGKGTLTYQTIELMADRLAAQISDEAITFAQTQLGWDAQTRTIAMLIREIREMIDSGIMRLAIAQATISGNTGGIWTSATDPISELVEKLGVAKVAVQNDYYEPASFLMSLTNADRLSNWDGFTAAGMRATAREAPGSLGPGDTGLRIKGLPVFASTEMPDTKATVQHRELVQHRVLRSKPMSLKGPYPTYSNDKLVAAEQWFLEEYNQTVSLIANKGGYVTIA